MQRVLGRVRNPMAQKVRLGPLFSRQFHFSSLQYNQDLADQGYKNISDELDQHKPHQPQNAVMIPHDVPLPMQHLFDTQKIYAQLKYSGFTTRQAETIVKTLKSMIEDLYKNTEERSVPKSLAENEAYLFNAATSEIRDEAVASQFSRDTQYKSKLARLQRDVEILQHEAGEMTVLLRADMDMDINERKTLARNEENTLSLRLQEAENKINVGLASELKSEIEQLRWQITRRGIVAILFVSVVILYVTKFTRTEEAKKSRAEGDNKGAEYKVPMLSTGSFSQDPEDVVVEELNYEQPSKS